MSKRITSNQLLGQIGEAAVNLRFLNMGFQFDVRSRLEAGIDGIAEVMDQGRPLARMIAVQVKSTDAGSYASEDDVGFTYLLRPDDLEYWRGTNLPVILVLYRKSDNSFFWTSVLTGFGPGERRLRFDKRVDVLDVNAVDRLAALTVPKAGFGYYIPPLGGGEIAIVNILPITLPLDVFVSTTPYTVEKATALLLDEDEPSRFDWVIKGGSFWSFHNPLGTVTRRIVDVENVEAVSTSLLAFHEDVDQRSNFAFLLRQALGHQVKEALLWDKDRRLFYFRSTGRRVTRTFSYLSSKKRTSADVVKVVLDKSDRTRVGFVRHHAFVPRFESLYDQWFLVVEPTYFFTTNGVLPHPHPGALLAGKKQLDKSASIRGQVIMWHRFLSAAYGGDDLFADSGSEPYLKFGAPPDVPLATRVPEDVWGAKGQGRSDNMDGEGFDFG